MTKTLISEIKAEVNWEESVMTLTKFVIYATPTSYLFIHFISLLFAKPLSISFHYTNLLNKIKLRHRKVNN